ncbi:conserved exported hypothetical protein [Candidatus Roizmanbacteria bacterium]|nr:conserved exported hypothetical protein [Candidatus Roizmanbacteria bacterium]
MKKIFFIFTLFLFLFLFKINASAKEPAHVLIINQVRGEECCSKGSLDKLKMQVEAHISKKIPAYFALRYDVLTDDTFINYLKDAGNKYPDLIKFGLLLEMTPQLIKTAGVDHDINSENWFEAQNAFTIGYSKEDSKKIADYLFATFFEKFSYYPAVTSAWMIDTETLNYIHKEYGVKIQQITREQYGTDSYTLYGGPPHYPYPASKNWLFVPDYENNDPVLIVRQTVTDPLFNYGDNTSTFTSQPNDYMKNKKTFDYFKSLLDQAIDQSDNQTGFAMLGLENSMEDKFQQEYIAQLELLGKRNSEGLVKFVIVDEMVSFWKQNKISVYAGKDLINNFDWQAFWITTPQYRVRLIRKNKNLMITDIRLYDQKFSDPYSNYEGKKSGYWIVPYLVNGSVNFYANKNKSAPKNIINYPDTGYGLFDIKKDLEIDPSAILLPDIFDQKSLKIDSFVNRVEISYLKNSKDRFRIAFANQNIQLTQTNKNEILYKIKNKDLSPIKFNKTPTGFKLNWMIGKNVFIGLVNQCGNNSCMISFLNNPEWLLKVRIEQYPFIFPEPIDRQTDLNKSSFYPHNQYAIAGRNPVRLIFSTRDKYNSPVITDSKITVLTSSLVQKTSTMQNPANQFVQYIDIYNDQPKKLEVSIKLDNSLEIKLNKPIYFAPNCKKEIKYCLTHPIEAYWYLRSFIGDKLRK